MRAGDTVYHTPSAETWWVAAVSECGRFVYPGGWPETCAESADCTVVVACPDSEHLRALFDVSGSTGIRASLAKAELQRVQSGIVRCPE